MKNIGKKQINSEPNSAKCYGDEKETEREGLGVAVEKLNIYLTTESVLHMSHHS